MARPGVSYEEAKLVFTSILIQGESLSIQRARESFGSGSNSTWQQHLAKFREEQKGKSIRTLPETFPEELVPMFEQLWVKANEAAENRFEEEQAIAKKKEDGHKKEVQALEAKINLLKEEIDNALENIDTLEEAHSKLDHTLQEKEHQFIRINTKNNAQIESLIDKNRALLKQLDELKDTNKQLVTRHEHAVKGLSANHANELKRLENSEAKWISLYDESKQQTKQLNKQLSQITDENAALKVAEKKQVSLETELKISKEQLERSDNRISRLESANIQLLKDNESLKVQLDNKNNTYKLLMDEANQLKQQIRDLVQGKFKAKRSKTG